MVLLSKKNLVHVGGEQSDKLLDKPLNNFIFFENQVSVFIG